MHAGAELIRELRAAGMTVELAADRIVVAPRERITEQLRTRLKFRRQEALEHLLLEQRIKDMARRWQYSADELTESLTAAAIDPDGWRQWVAHDEQQCAISGSVFAIATGHA